MQWRSFGMGFSLLGQWLSKYGVRLLLRGGTYLLKRIRFFQQHRLPCGNTHRSGSSRLAFLPSVSLLLFLPTTALRFC